MKEAERTRVLVEVVWDDAVTGDDTWIKLDGDEDLPVPERAYTVGYLIRDCPSYVSVAQTWGLKKNETEEVGNVWTIPRGMVIRIVHLAGGPVPDVS